MGMCRVGASCLGHGEMLGIFTLGGAGADGIFGGGEAVGTLGGGGEVGASNLGGGTGRPDQRFIGEVVG